MFDSIVIGGGIVGASLAYHLVKAGANTMNIDRHDTGRATDAGAGILTPKLSQSGADDWNSFFAQAFQYYAPLIDALHNEQDQDTSFATCGILRVAVDDDELDAYSQAHETIFRQHQQSGEVYDVTSDEAKERFPALATVQRAFYSPQAARVDGRKMCAALTKAAVKHGLQIKHSAVEHLIIKDEKVTGVVVDGEEILAHNVAIAGGAWSQSFGDQLGVHIPVEPQRGQIIHLQLEGVDTSNWSVVHAFRGHYIVTWEGGRVVVGATRETGSGFVPRTTASGIQSVLDEALRVAPGLSMAQILEIRVGLRPYVADLRPVMGSVPAVDNIYLATGHGASGLQLGPYSGKVIADLMTNQPLDANLQPFSITRFA